LAWDGRTLAADRLSCHANLKQSGRKIHDCGDFVYAQCGAVYETNAIRRWLAAGAPTDARPTLDGEGSWGIVVRKETAGKLVYLVQGKQPELCPVREKFVADGSGRDFALAAMYLGKTAREAIVVAAHFDVYTGGGADAVVLVSKRRGRAA
jgi:hypothetical protein